MVCIELENNKNPWQPIYAFMHNNPPDGYRSATCAPCRAELLSPRCCYAAVLLWGALVTLSPRDPTCHHQTLPVAVGLDLCDLCGPLQPGAFYGSMIPHCMHGVHRITEENHNIRRVGKDL